MWRGRNVITQSTSFFSKEPDSYNGINIYFNSWTFSFALDGKFWNLKKKRKEDISSAWLSESAIKQQQAICVSCGKEGFCWALVTLALMYWVRESKETTQVKANYSFSSEMHNSSSGFW